MNRRVFTSAVASAPFAIAANASAQESSPVASPAASPEAREVRKHPLSDQPGFIQAVLRYFEATEEGIANVLEGGLVLFQTSVSEFDTVDNASQALNYLATALPQSLQSEENGATGTDIFDVELGDPGDERIGIEVLVTFAEGALFDQLAMVAALIRKDRWVEILLGGGLEPGWDVISEVGNTVDSRWPSEDVWQMVPEIEDVPAGLAVSEEREVLPGE